MEKLSCYAPLTIVDVSLGDIGALWSLLSPAMCGERGGLGHRLFHAFGGSSWSAGWIEGSLRIHEAYNIEHENWRVGASRGRGTDLEMSGSRRW